MGNVTAKTSGDIASFMTPAETNIKSLKVHFSPKQLGTGDPSPENVREIVGWDGVEVNGCGKNIAHIFGYGAQNITDTNVTKYKTTNNYGTKINTTIFNNPDTPLIIEQSQAPNATTPSSYQNGYIVVGTDNLIFEKSYNVSFKVSNITNNLLDIDYPNYIRLLVPNGGAYNVDDVIDNTLIFKDIKFSQNTNTPKRQGFEIRISGMSFTLSEFMVTPVDDNDFDYEPYQGNNILTSWTKNIKQWTYTDTTIDDSYPSDNFNGYANGRWDNAIVDIPSEWFGKELTYSAYIERSSSPLNNYDDVRVWCYGDSTTFFDAKTAQRIYTAEKSGRSWVTFTIPEGTTKIGLGLYLSKGSRAYNPQLEYGSEPTEYQPYVGTVYGGYIDLISGELVEEYNFVNIDYSNPWSTTTNYLYRNDNLPPSIGGRNMYVKTLCSHRINPYDVTAAVVAGTQGNLSVGRKFCEMAGIEMTSDAFNQYLEEQNNNGTPLEICYLLKTPITHQLTPTQLSSFIGQNNFWSNADYVEIEYELKETEDIQKARKKIILNQPHIESVKGDLVNFTTNMKAPLKECKVYFEPVQEGSGDPSPDNVREIVGWDGVDIATSGENMVSLGAIYCGKFIPRSTGFVQGSVYPTYYIPAPKGTIYITKKTVDVVNKFTYLYLVDDIPDTGITWYGINGKTASDGGVTGFVNYTTRTIDNTDGHKFLCIGCANVSTNFTEDIQENNLMISMESHSYTDYVAPTGGEIKSIDWSSSVGTIYGGYFDLVKGELVATHMTFTLDGVNHYLGGGGVINSNNMARAYGYIGQTNGLSDLPLGERNSYIYACNKYIVPHSSGQEASDEGVYCGSGYPYIRMVLSVDKISDTSSAAKIREGINNWLSENPIQICYIIAEPIHYQLTPQQLLTFKGTNNIWSNSNGQTEVKFWTH